MFQVRYYSLGLDAIVTSISDYGRGLIRRQHAQVEGGNKSDSVRQKGMDRTVIW